MRSLSFLAVAALLLANTAYADPDGVLVNGKSNDHDRDLASHVVATLLSARGWTLASTPLPTKSATAIAACLATPAATKCAGKLVQDNGLGKLAVLSLEPDPAHDQTVLNARVIEPGSDTIFIAFRYCDHCTDDTLSALAKEATGEALDRMALHDGRTVLRITSVPDGARFTVDGSSSGATNASIDVVPGNHVVRVELAGYDAQERQVETVEGKTAEVHIDLHKHGEPATTPPPQTPSVPQTPPAPITGTPAPLPGTLAPTPPIAHPVRHKLAIAGTFIGIAGVVGGGVAFLFNQHNVVEPPGTYQPPTYRDTIPPGVALVISGAVVAAVSGYFWWHYSKTPVVAPVPGGAVVGFGGEF